MRNPTTDHFMNGETSTLILFFQESLYVSIHEMANTWDAKVGHNGTIPPCLGLKLVSKIHTTIQIQ